MSFDPGEVCCRRVRAVDSDVVCSLGTGALQALSYTHDSVGNIKTISDSLTGELQSFNYDKLDRLTNTTVTNGPAPYGETYDYNATTGNLASNAGASYIYGDAAHKHAATSAGGNTYTYDANGNPSINSGQACSPGG